MHFQINLNKNQALPDDTKVTPADRDNSRVLQEMMFQELQKTIESLIPTRLANLDDIDPASIRPKLSKAHLSKLCAAIAKHVN